MKRIDKSEYLGKTFGFLQIITEGESQLRGSQLKSIVFCKCYCGKIKEIQLNKVMSGHTTSCGCTKIGRRTHFKRDHPLYRVWDGMKYRCNTETCNSYENYGGRGITVCEEWNDSFESFYNWCIQNGWERGLQIDRIDNNRGYHPRNCRIVTPKDNSRNRRDNRYVNVEGKAVILAEAIEEGYISKSKYYKNSKYRESFSITP